MRQAHRAGFVADFSLWRDEQHGVNFAKQAESSALGRRTHSKVGTWEGQGVQTASHLAWVATRAVLLKAKASGLP